MQQKSLNSVGSILLICRYLCKSGRSSNRLKLASAAILEGLSIAVALAVPYSIKIIVDLLQERASPQLILVWAAGYGLIWSLSELLDRIKSLAIIAVMEQTQRFFTVDYLSQILMRPFATCMSQASGEIISKFNQLKDAVPRIVDGLFWQIIPILVKLILTVSIVAWQFNWIYAMLLLITLILYFLSTISFAKRTAELQLKTNKAENVSMDRIIDTLRNISLVKTYSMEEYELNGIDRVIQRQQKLSINTVKSVQFFSSMQVIILGFGLAALTMYASNQVLLGLLTIGGFVQINGYLLQFTLPASYFGYIVMETRRALVSLCTFTSVMNKPLPVQNRSNKLFLTPPSISLSDVCFSYPNSPLILRDISFNVQPGDFIAIVGRSGSGKSTLLKLLLRLYTASSGKILINGVSILDFSPDSLRHSIGYVTQEAQLFNRTLYENITYGNQRESRASAQEILGAVQLIHLENYLDAPVGENGSCLSGGERQRVAISRALGHQPQLLLLDEPSSALDARTEGLIINRLLRESRATKLVVTHRIASIQTATRILVMDKGSIVEQGTHEVLLRASGLYLELWRKQHGTDKLT